MNIKIIHFAKQRAKKHRDLSKHRATIHFPAKLCMHAIIELRLSKVILLNIKLIIPWETANLSQLMPNPYVVICAVPWLGDAVEMVSLCILRSLWQELNRLLSVHIVKLHNSFHIRRLLNLTGHRDQNESFIKTCLLTEIKKKEIFLKTGKKVIKITFVCFFVLATRSRDLQIFIDQVTALDSLASLVPHYKLGKKSFS